MPSSLRNTARQPPFPPSDVMVSVDPPFKQVRPNIPHIDARIAFTAPSQDPASRETDEWINTTHFLPAAWPRSHRRSARSDIYAPDLPSTSALGELPIDAQASKEEQKRRREQDFKYFEHMCGGPDTDAQVLRFEELRDVNYKQNHAERIAEARAANERQLWMAVNRIVPCSPSDAPPSKEHAAKQGITLILCHANGFHKEIFEPALHSLIQKLTSDDHRGKYRIDEIWNFDCTHSGHAASVNRDNLGDTIAWPDHARDIIQFLERYIPQKPTSPGQPVAWPPAFLAPSSKSSSSPSSSRGSSAAPQQKRRFIALGHSFGGGALNFVLGARPQLLEGLVLIDPAIVEFDESGFDSQKLPTEPQEGRMPLPLMIDVPLAKGAIARKDVFANMPEARKYFESKSFFRAWTDRVLDLHLRFGLRPSHIPPTKALVADDVDENDLKRTKLELTNSKWHEGAAFASTFMGRNGRAILVEGKYRAWITHLSMCLQGFDNRLLAADIDKLDKGVAFHVEGNHLIAQENPDLLADYIVKAFDTQSSPETLRQHKLHSKVQKPRL
ncbi:hypothetical protein BCV70DRAFT_201851 [Testicularia cyperi]|uniref:AB hydrolase-1 domain-containing protein n=1 Tax=Testicularia cyperi TaxID=1882483 RepID=A0A317XJT5_9BASI|nr:hypothetical protein BCV70DRAFT_201851 [Testicularia cyperi]